MPKNQIVLYIHKKTIFLDSTFQHKRTNEKPFANNLYAKNEKP